MIDPEVKRQLAQMYRDGKTAVAIAEELGIKTTSVRYAVHRYGLTRTPRGAGRRWSEDDLAAVLALVEAGAKNRDIAEQFGVSVHAIARIVNRHNFGKTSTTPWTDADVELLKKMVGIGMTHRQISAAFGRSLTAVKQKLRYVRQCRTDAGNNGE